MCYIRPMLDREAIKAKARQIGFTLVGITNDIYSQSVEFYDWWLAQGYAANMQYLARQKTRRKSIREIHPEAESVIVCALRFPGAANAPADPCPQDRGTTPLGKVARYAQGEDYHHVLRQMLQELATFIDQSADLKDARKCLAYVDTGAIPERAYGAQAGLGWIGKNSMLIHPEEGSWFWLGEVITPLRFTPDTLPLTDHCGKCRRCIDACPTQAILEDARAVDSRKCISYLTIEHRGPIPEHFHAPMQDWLLGCDICQEVCPWNAQSLRKGRATIGAPPLEQIPLQELTQMSEAEFQQRFGRRAIARAKAAGLARNAEIIEKNGRPRI